jgi:hypothetical protein
MVGNNETVSFDSNRRTLLAHHSFSRVRFQTVELKAPN